MTCLHSSEHSAQGTRSGRIAAPLLNASAALSVCLPDIRPCKLLQILPGPPEPQRTPRLSRFPQSLQTGVSYMYQGCKRQRVTGDRQRSLLSHGLL